jgi:hypothetical protein
MASRSGGFSDWQMHGGTEERVSCLPPSAHRAQRAKHYTFFHHAISLPPQPCSTGAPLPRDPSLSRTHSPFSCVIVYAVKVIVKV